jgi:hypothetical protein
VSTPQSTDRVAAADAPRRRFQCITIDAESVVLNGEDFDRMTAELTRLRADVDRDKNRECANAWHTVWSVLMDIDPRMHERKVSGLECALDLIHELANRPALDKTP